ncbi:hypothetical protein PF005_g15041 [Phytophthora fragariae]|uniref:Uncharacterized protein n=1 Tax=Phytophthora fragariae TaxID=53985 RepID=A0A6A3EIZ3_9STRA|nr:hypothetical protein PF009_g16330 [Phytophthora fragariae]KAE9100932.1 hypothetical protein PF010_g14629 [Phytophthora fragariae]KAE9143360.1 hypothetical protein PF006_g11603 [Phytophthora fragariae]KAE9201223.1 hypothetical protein PF005_g15041 [Phytophthora fragariae]KAE9217641.1 hypothetical protein PF004_g14097 [Phytophthora fragariae]
MTLALSSMACFTYLASLTSGGMLGMPVNFLVLYSTLNLRRRLSKSRSGAPRGLFALYDVARLSHSSRPSGSSFSISSKRRSTSAEV